jgi:hypothetical protein
VGPLGEIVPDDGLAASTLPTPKDAMSDKTTRSALAVRRGAAARGDD